MYQMIVSISMLSGHQNLCTEVHRHQTWESLQILNSVEHTTVSLFLSSRRSLFLLIIKNTKTMNHLFKRRVKRCKCWSVNQHFQNTLVQTYNKIYKIWGTYTIPRHGITRNAYIILVWKPEGRRWDVFQRCFLALSSGRFSPLKRQWTTTRLHGAIIKKTAIFLAAICIINVGQHTKLFAIYFNIIHHPSNLFLSGFRSNMLQVFLIFSTIIIEDREMKSVNVGSLQSHYAHEFHKSLFVSVFDSGVLKQTEKPSLVFMKPLNF